MLPTAAIPVSLFGAPLAGTELTASAASLTSGIVAAGGTTLTPGVTAAPAPFADLMTDAVGQVQMLEADAKAKIEGLISGRGVDVHEAMIAAQKSEMGFELVLSVRNKALAAYQQVVGMQF
jgi:flagellar hook-basal body complex protein FliE